MLNKSYGWLFLRREVGFANRYLGQGHVLLYSEGFFSQLTSDEGAEPSHIECMISKKLFSQRLIFHIPSIFTTPWGSYFLYPFNLSLHRLT